MSGTEHPIKCPCCDGTGTLMLAGTPGERLRELLERTQTTVRMLGDAIDKSPAAISMMMTGRLRVTAESRKAIAQYFGVAEEALGGE